MDPWGLWLGGDLWRGFVRWFGGQEGDLTDRILHGATDFSAGMGDTISLGGTKWLRERMGTDEYVRYGSGWHTAGRVGGYAWWGAAGYAAVGAGTPWVVSRLSSTVTITRWIPAGGTMMVGTGQWVMRGGQNIVTYLLSGVWQPIFGNPGMPYAYANAITALVSRGYLRWPIAEEGVIGFLKGLIGQRIYTGPPICPP